MAVAVAMYNQERALHETMNRLYQESDTQKLLYKTRTQQAQERVEDDHDWAGNIQFRAALLSAVCTGLSICFSGSEVWSKGFQTGATTVVPAGSQALSSHNQKRLTSDELAKQQALQEVQASGQRRSAIEQLEQRKQELDKELIRQIAEGMKGCLRS